MTDRSERKKSADFFSLWRTPALNENAEAANHETERSVEEARQAGFESGRLEALQKFRTEYRARLVQLDATVEALQRPFAELNEQIGEELARLAVKIARALVRRELRTEPEIILALVRDAVGALNTAEAQIYIHLNPADARLVRELTQLSEGEEQEQSWRPVEDPLITRGDCKVVCRDSLVDGKLETRLNQMITHMLGNDRSEQRS